MREIFSFGRLEDQNERSFWKIKERSFPLDDQKTRAGDLWKTRKRSFPLDDQKTRVGDPLEDQNG